VGSPFVFLLDAFEAFISTYWDCDLHSVYGVDNSLGTRRCLGSYQSARGLHMELDVLEFFSEAWCRSNDVNEYNAMWTLLLL
jgi:hypothetical protein